eukprot:gene35685-55384_t
MNWGPAGDHVSARCSKKKTAPPTVLMRAQVHRLISVGDVVGLHLGDLSPRHNRRMLTAAPLRLESEKRDSAKLSFRHATVHDSLMAARVVREHAARGPGCKTLLTELVVQDPKVQAVALVPKASQPTLRAMIND